MAPTNHDRAGKALDLLREGLAPFLEREIANAPNRTAVANALEGKGNDRAHMDRPIAEWDAAALLRAMADLWDLVFTGTLGNAERALVSELREIRNRWAHQQAFSTDDAYRALDSVGRLLTAVAAPQAAEVEKAKTELLRVKFEEDLRTAKRRTAGTAIESEAAAHLKPWREVVSPHPDVASGRYQQAEFAADLWQVHLREGSAEYRDPVEFYRRTFLTESLKRLLIGAVQRLSSGKGDPVVQLQTNFGGGKTHSMLALYHLFSDKPPSELQGVDEIVKESGVTRFPTVQRVVLVGNKISPGNPVTKPDGTVVVLRHNRVRAPVMAREARDRRRTRRPNARLRSSATVMRSG